MVGDKVMFLDWHNDPDAEYLYRYESRRTASVDEWDNLVGSRTHLYLTKYKVLKWTPKGAWINYFGNSNNKKFVLLTARKQFACKTEKDALTALMFRKKRYISILSSRIRDVEETIRLCEGRLNNELY